MKTILSALLCDGAQCRGPLAEDCEILQMPAQTSQIKQALKRANGKYAFIANRDILPGEQENFLRALCESDADVIAFCGGFCFKTQILKSLREFSNFSEAQISALISSKCVLKIQEKPFEYAQKQIFYSENLQEALTRAIDMFGKEKGKLPREIYSLAFETLQFKLLYFYMAAMLEIRKNKELRESFIAFDLALKENIVLYLALEKRFTAANLSKLRKNKFKITYFTSKKFKKAIKKAEKL